MMTRAYGRTGPPGNRPYIYQRLIAFLLGVGIAGTLALLLANCGGRKPAPPLDILASVNIRVRETGGDNTSVVGATVTIAIRGEKQSKVSDAGGWVRWSDVDPGPRHVWIEAEGYHDFDQHFTVEAPITSLTVAIEPAPVAPEPGPGRRGRVRLDGHSYIDDDGTFNAIGASLFWAMCAAEKQDWAKLDRNLAFVREHGAANYVRILGEVGGHYWRDCTINPRRSAYVSELRQVLDHIGAAGMRAEISIFGGLDYSTSEALRRQTIRKVLEAIQGREHLVQNVEIANEPFHEAIGFRDYGRSWVENIRALGQYYLRQEAAMGVKPMLLSLGSPALDRPGEWGCELYPTLYAGFPQGRRLTTPHYPRNMSTVQRYWRHVRQPWFEGDPFCRGAFDAIQNDEPSGPGASVTTMDSVSAHAGMMALSVIAGGTSVLFHSHGGIVGYGANANGKPDIFSHANAAQILQAMRSVRNLLPGDIGNWRRFNWHWTGAPFQGRVPHWDERDHQNGHGVISFYSACRGETCWTVITGVKGHPHIRAARRMRATLYGYTGKVLAEQTLASGQGLTLPGDGDPFNDRRDVFLLKTEDR